MKTLKRMLSLLLCMVMLVSYLPHHVKAVGTSSAGALAQTVTDPGTAHSWETMMGTEEDGNRYAGRVWVDKSVYQDGDTAILNTRGEEGSSFQVSLADDETFQIIFSALGSTMTTKHHVSSTGPMDVVLVLDTSTSMEEEDAGGVTRLERTMAAANELLDDLLTIKEIRIAIVTYNSDSETVLPLGIYKNGIKLVVTDYYHNGSSDAGVVTVYDHNGKKLGNDSGYTKGTNLQSGIDRGFNILANATNVEGRVPVAIVLTDGQANRASKEGFYEIGSHSDQDGEEISDRNLYLSTLLGAAYTKTKIEAHYGKAAAVYTVGVDITDNVTAKLLMNPADTVFGFHSRNSDTEVKRAYENFQKWAKGETVNHSGWTFDHHYPKQDGTINDAKIAANINYTDTYYDVSNAELSETFEQIYVELSSGVFNPISSSTSVDGGTGEDNTPLIYVDFIGQYMEIKEIQAITLFGNSYGVVKHSDGSYTVTEATGINPTTNETWNTAEDILISVTQHEGVQRLEIKINQQILPIIMEQVVSETAGDTTVSTITELMQAPLRVYYTVGLASDILLPNGEVDISEIQGYPDIDDENGTVSFYSNRFGVMNQAGGGDAHVGFKPSGENRFYYHQSNQGIFTKITNQSDGSSVTVPENNEYGILWNEYDYDLTWMTYEDYQSVKDTDKVYTYVSYYRPTPDAADAKNAAEEVTYLVYTDWKYLKESVTFYDAASKTYLNEGEAVAKDRVENMVADYILNNPNAELYAVLGVGSLRTSRLHNMTLEKIQNSTQTAPIRYAPEYTYETASVHSGNDVVVWLGNNGKLTLPIDTGIALTKKVTEAIGNADDTYALTVAIPSVVIANPVVVDEKGNSVESTYRNHVLTVQVKANQTVYISGIPGGTQCEIGEMIAGDYYIAGKTDKVTVPLVSEALNGGIQFVPAVVTNSPNKYGNLFITKEITSDHAVPQSVLDTPFEVKVDLGAAMAGEFVTVANSDRTDLYGVMLDASGSVTFRIKARQTIELLRLPAGTPVNITETLPDDHFTVSYRTRNHSGENADSDNELVIPAEGSATAVVLNHYTPAPVELELDIVGTKNFIAEGAHEGGEFRYQVQKWNGSAWENISGKTAQTPYAQNESGTKTFTIENVLEGITYTEVGDHAYQVLEAQGDVGNVTYDRTLYAFNVTVTDNGGQLVAAVTDLNNHPITDGTYEVTFNNTYHTAPVSVDIFKEIDNRSGDTTVSKAGFEFHAVQTDAHWKEQKGESASMLTVFSDAAGEARLTATYKTAGVYYYVLTEVNKNAPGWIYSDAQYRITVTVTENAGELTAALDIEKVNSGRDDEKGLVNPEDATSGAVFFVNTYDPEDASVNLDGAVSKELTGMTLEADQFTFCVYQDGDRTAPVLTGTNDLNGDVSFVDFNKVLTFETEGKYQYDILEVIPDGAVYNSNTGKYVLNGMSYDPTVYDLVVEVYNDIATGKLTATYYFEDAVSETVTFRNSYHATPVEYTLGGTKILHGRAPRDGEFAFELYEGADLKQTVTNISDGSFHFHPITYTVAGTYTYTIKEVSGELAGIRYDGAQKPVTVTVTVTDLNGVLKASSSLSNEEIKFENTYVANPAQVTFNGTKKLVGGTVEDDAFTFRLYSTDSSFDITASTAELLSTTRNVDGAFAFTSIFSHAGTYYFVVLEDATVNPVENVIYDRTQYPFMVKVTDIGDGQLRANVTNMVSGVSNGPSDSVSTDVAFTNAVFEEVIRKEVYLEGNTETKIDGQKVNPGDILTYFISYTNYTGEMVVIDIMDTIPAHTTYVEGSASHNGGYVGTHVNWILNVASGRKMTVSFDVRVDEPEAIVANRAAIRDGFNIYHTNEVVNHTIGDVFKKDVFSAEDDAVSIDGRKVYEGDELLYDLTFTNASRDVADIQITDMIPEYTSYVAGSADNGGVYENGAVVWSFEDVPAWSTVSVSFRVTVNNGVGAVTIANQATATDGTNQFETKWVSNYTVKDPVEKKVFDAKEPSVNVDGKSVNAGDTLIYEISYKNTSDEKTTVTVTDTIPAHTSYLNGTADNGGVYHNGVIIWTLDVEPGAVVSVTFKVKVDQQAGVTIKNKAAVYEGKNSYTTNEVTNAVAKTTIPSIPQTDDTISLQLWFIILFLSSAALAVTVACGKKTGKR